MALKDLVFNAVSDAIKATDDLATVCTYVKNGGSGAYDPVTGSTTPAMTNYPGITAVLVKFAADEKDDDIVILTDSKALIAAKDLPVVPGKNDRLISDKGTWDVRRILGVPGDSLWILHVRLMR